MYHYFYLEILNQKLMQDDRYLHFSVHFKLK